MTVNDCCSVNDCHSLVIIQSQSSQLSHLRNQHNQPYLAHMQSLYMKPMKHHKTMTSKPSALWLPGELHQHFELPNTVPKRPARRGRGARLSPAIFDGRAFPGYMGCLHMHDTHIVQSGVNIQMPSHNIAQQSTKQKHLTSQLRTKKHLQPDNLK